MFIYSICKKKSLLWIWFIFVQPDDCLSMCWINKNKVLKTHFIYIYIYCIYYINIYPQKKHKQTSYRDCIKEKNLQFRCKIWYLKLWIPKLSDHYNPTLIKKHLNIFNLLEKWIELILDKLCLNHIKLM